MFNNAPTGETGLYALSNRGTLAEITALERQPFWQLPRLVGTGVERENEPTRIQK